MSKTTDQQVISRALALLQAGLLASSLPGRLMSEFGLSPERAGALAGEAIKRRQEGKQDG